MSNNKGSLGDRMKGYENISRIYLIRRTPTRKESHTGCRCQNRRKENDYGKVQI